MIKTATANMVSAFADVYTKALDLVSDGLDMLIPIKSALTAAGQNPGAQSTSARVLGGVAVAGSLFGVPERAGARLTTSQAGDLAAWLGYEGRVKDAPFNSMGQAVFTNGKNFITQDVTMHRGAQAMWKMFDRQGNRLGTFTYDLLTKLGK